MVMAAMASTETPSYRFYETWKNQAQREFFYLSGPQYERLVAEIAKAAGV